MRTACSVPCPLGHQRDRYRSPPRGHRARAFAAWCAFEGSFSFDHLLSADVAKQVYAAADAAGAHLAIDDRTRYSAEWSDRVTSLGQQLTGAPL